MAAEDLATEEAAIVYIGVVLYSDRGTKRIYVIV